MVTSTLHEKTIYSKGHRSVGEGRAMVDVLPVGLGDDLSKVSDTLPLHPSYIIKSGWVTCQMSENLGHLGLEGHTSHKCIAIGVCLS